MSCKATCGYYAQREVTWLFQITMQKYKK